MIFDVAGTTQVAVEFLGDDLLEIGASDWRLRESLAQDLALVGETGGAITALEGEVGDEGLLQDRQLAVPGIAFNRADRLAAKLAAGPMQVGLV
jgi:hypothetical protein